MKKKSNIRDTGGIGRGLLAFGLVSAFQGMGFGVQENKDEIQAALEAGDYDAWKAAYEATLTEDNFNQQKEMFQNRERMRTNQEAIQQAIEDGDYEAWQEAVANCENARLSAEDISEEEFQIMVQMHQARQSGDFETAQELQEELGVDMPFGKGMGMHKGFGRGMFREQSMQTEE